MSIADRAENGGTPKPKGKAAQKAQGIDGNELGLALRQTAALQAQQIEGLLNAYQMGMDTTAETVADYIAQEMQGGLIERVMVKVAERYQAPETNMAFDVPSVTVPERKVEQTRSTFLGLFAAESRPNPFLIAGEAND